MTTLDLFSSVQRSSVGDYYYAHALERAKQHGVQTLTEADLIALLLPTTPAAHELAVTLLTHFRSLRALLTADAETAAAAGLDAKGHVTLQAALELTRRHYQELMTTGTALSNPRATREFVRMRMRDLPHEIFACIYLNNRNCVIGFEELFRGTIDGASVHPREVVKHALKHNAAAVVLVHNHPSGIPAASQADELITRRLKEALSLVDIRVFDHLIVGDGVCESFAERGLL